MIETTDIRELFEFFGETLSSEGYRLGSANTETQAMLELVQHEQAPVGNEELMLDFSLQQFADTLRELGRDAEFMWPGTTTESAGLRLLLTHLDEQRATSDLGVGRKRLSLRDREPLLSADEVP